MQTSSFKMHSNNSGKCLHVKFIVVFILKESSSGKREKRENAKRNYEESSVKAL